MDAPIGLLLRPENAMTYSAGVGRKLNSCRIRARLQRGFSRAAGNAFPPLGLPGTSGLKPCPDTILRPFRGRGA